MLKLLFFKIIIFNDICNFLKEVFKYLSLAINTVVRVMWWKMDIKYNKIIVISNYVLKNSDDSNLIHYNFLLLHGCVNLKSVLIICVHFRLSNFYQFTHYKLLFLTPYTQFNLDWTRTLYSANECIHVDIIN